ncbi:MAG: LamG domain-containing protein, partial [Planctomycetes bacterium]|nr:LamG domain-containing protein [Planctomycetota bacterium]
MKRHVTLLLAAVVAAAAAPAAGQAAVASDVPANVPKKGLVAHWAAEGDARDSAGQNHGALKGGATFAPGKFGQAFKLDGKDDYVDFGNPKALQITGSLTIAMWVRPDQLGVVRQNLLHKAYGGEGDVTLELNGQVVYHYGSAGANKKPYCFLVTGGRAGENGRVAGLDIGNRDRGPPVGQTKLKAGQWTHLVVVRDMKAKKLAWYVNGARVVQVQFLGPALAKASPLALYVGKGHEKNYAGLID